VIGCGPDHLVENSGRLFLRADEFVWKVILWSCAWKEPLPEGSGALKAQHEDFHGNACMPGLPNSFPPEPAAFWVCVLLSVGKVLLGQWRVDYYRAFSWWPPLLPSCHGGTWILQVLRGFEELAGDQLVSCCLPL
jgi:hypothetical protein